MLRFVAVLFLSFLGSASVVAEVDSNPSAANEWNDRFAAANQAMTDGDWESAVKIQEALIGDGMITVPLFKNLAIARSKQNAVAQSLAAWLAARDLAPHDASVRAGIDASLDALQIGREALDLAAHGPVVAWLADRTSEDLSHAIVVGIVLLSVTVMVVLLLLFLPKTQSGHMKFIQSLALICVVVTLTAWIFLLWWNARAGQWGVVVAPEGASIRSSAQEGATEVTKVKTGVPVFVTGDTYGPWLDVRVADGSHGWMNALSLRVIRTTP